MAVPLTYGYGTSDLYFEAPKGPELEQDRSVLSVCGENLLDYIEIKEKINAWACAKECKEEIRMMHFLLRETFGPDSEYRLQMALSRTQIAPLLNSDSSYEAMISRVNAELENSGGVEVDASASLVQRVLLSREPHPHAAGAY